MSILAIDAGTTTVKAAIVEDGGTITDIARVAVPRPREQGIAPAAIWDAVAEAIRSVDSADTVDAVTVCGQGDGLWTLDADLKPAGLAYEWNATNGAETIAQWEADGTIDSHFRRSGTVLWSGTTAALWRWATEHAPDIVANTRHVFYAKDWINFCLSGAIATDATDATIPFLNVSTRTYDAATFADLGCSDLADRMAPIVDAGARVGTVTADAASATGLAPGTPVLMGCIDGLALVRGSGIDGPGDAVAVLGTTAAAIGLTDSIDTTGEPVGATLCTGTDGGSYLQFMGASSGTSTLDWFLGAFYPDEAEPLKKFWCEVADARPGVLALPYLAGERTPFLAPSATGTFLGMTPQTRRGDVARAVALGITMSLRHCLDFALAYRPNRVVLTGGGAASSEWCQLTADVLQREILVDNRPHVACVGAAAVASGVSLDNEEMATFQPQQSFDDDFETFVSVGQAMRPIWSSMSDR